LLRLIEQVQKHLKDDTNILVLLFKLLVLIFDKEGNLRFVYYEKYGDTLDMEAISWAVAEARSTATSLA
jgi:hypothetical protein